MLTSCVPRATDGVTLRGSFWSTPAIEQEIARKFEATHPGVKLDLMFTGGRYAEKLQSMLVAANEPDLMMVTTAFYYDWAARGVLADLTDLVGELDAEGAFYPGPRDAFRYQGKYFAVPALFDGMVSIANLDALAAAGLSLPDESFTWAQLEAWGPKLSRLRGDGGALTDYACALPPPQYFITAYGVRCFDDPAYPQRVTVESPLAVEAIEYWRRMHAQGWAVARGTVLDQGESEMFRDGRTAFMFWGRAVTTILLQAPALNWDVAPVPAGPDGRVVPYFATAVGISRRSKHPELAREYLRFYVSETANESFVSGHRGLPLRRTAAGERLLASMTRPASVHRYMETLEPGVGQSLAQVPGTMELEAIIQRRFEQALAAPDVPAAEIVAGLAADLRAWLQKNQERGLL